MAVVTPTDVKDELSFGAAALGITDAEFDTLLEDLIGRETERVVDEIDVALGTETTAKTLSRPASVDGWDLPLPKRPVQSVESVEINGYELATGEYFVAPTHLELLPAATSVRWPTDRRSITVEWTHGYPEADIPEPVTGAIIALARSTLQEMEADGLESESVDGDSVSYEPRDDVVARHLGRAKSFDAPSYYGGTQVI